jgi:hypothetical protein
MAPSPGQGFETNVVELERYAAALEGVADALRDPIAILREHTPTPRPMPVAAVFGMEGQYSLFTEEIAARQRVLCERLTATAQTLGEIAALYRRVDGQG